MYALWPDEPVAPSVPIDGLSEVTRFEVIDGTGRAMVRYGVTVKAHLQDGARTLKIFLDERGEEA
jgi:hypothetical protein